MIRWKIAATDATKLQKSTSGGTEFKRNLFLDYKNSLAAQLAWRVLSFNPAQTSRDAYMETPPTPPSAEAEEPVQE